MLDIVQFIGPHQALLRNSEHNHELYANCGFQSKISNAPIEELQELVGDMKPRTAVIRGAWCPLSTLIDLAKRFPHIRFYITNHSTAQQMYSHKEWHLFIDSTRYLRDSPNAWITCADVHSLAFLQALAPEKVVHAPNFYAIPRDVELTRIANRADELHVGAFFVLRYQKNVPTIAAAACVVQQRLHKQGRRLVLHHITRESTFTQHMGEYINLWKPVIMSGASVVNDGWTNTGREHLNICRRMDVHVQPSWAESFNYAAGDAIITGCPLVGSPTISWLPPSWIVQPYAVMDIADKILAAPTWDVSEGLHALKRVNWKHGVIELVNFGLCDEQEAKERMRKGVADMIEEA